jgi:hypothetical protein
VVRSLLVLASFASPHVSLNLLLTHRMKENLSSGELDKLLALAKFRKQA